MMGYKKVGVVEFTVSCTVEHRWAGGLNATAQRMSPGQQLGNVGGHFAGIWMSMGEGPISLRLRTVNGLELFEKIPTDALRVVSEE